MEKNTTNKPSSFIEDITGLDLSIDNSIQKLCELTNSASSNTRSVWYIIIIVSTLSFAELWNTRPKNNLNETIENLHDSIVAMQHSLLINDSVKKLDNIADTSRAKFQLLLYKSYLDQLRRSEFDNINTIRIPIVGNAFYVHDLGIFAGFAFIVLLLLLRFALKRKVSNLKIALKAITKRYEDKADEKHFMDYIEKSADKTQTLYAINYCRRKYHYNFLSMNESVSTDDDDNEPAKTRLKKAIDNKIRNKVKMSERIIYIPLIITILLLANDIGNIYTNKLGFYQWNHLFLLINIFYICLIYYFTIECIEQSRKLDNLYVHFKNNGYRHL